MAGMSQPRISEIERPGERKLNLETLFRLAEAYDVALLVKFVPFTEFVDTTDGLRLDGLSIKPFDEDLKDLENNEIWAKGKKTLDAMLQKPEVARRSEKEPKDNPLNPIKRKVIEMPKDLNSALSGNDSQEGKEEKFYEACGG
jgi:transcriptional regulator with XRE-family HTH domain